MEYNVIQWLALGNKNNKGVLKMKDFRSTNGLWVTFVSRYHEENTYEVTDKQMNTKRVMENNKVLSIHLPYHTDIIDYSNAIEAVQEYLNKEHEEFIVWCKEKNIDPAMVL
jgi:hypothetical protein